MSSVDKIDLKIIEMLAADSRRSLADIGNSVDLAPSSVNERIRRLVAAGVIRRFTVEVDPASLDRATQIYVWVALREDADEGAFREFAGTDPRIEECHHVTGAWSYLIKLRLKDVSAVEEFLSDLKSGNFLGRSETVLALSSPVEAGVIPKGA